MPDTEQSLVLLSKLQPPQIKTHTLRRRRLIDHLSENLHKKLILLCAGAGYGKTTLLSQFISSKKIPYIYYHLERSDREPAVFFAYLIAGIRKFAPDFGKKVEKLRNFFNHPQHYLDIIVGTFINEIIEHIKDDFYIILEDYHSLHSADLIDGILAYLLDHLPAHLHFVITTRTAPVFPLSGLRARGEIYELDNEQLRFTKEEIRRLFEQGHDVSFSIKESELNWVAEHSEGWPTSLRLMLQSSDYMKGIRTRGYLKRIMESYYRSQSNLFNYFAQEIFSQETKEIKRFLVDCSLFEWLTPGLCKAVTGSRRSAEILDDLTTRNVFVFDIPGVGYRIHHLFREFLISKLNDVEREKRIYERAARYYTRKNLLEEAIKYYLFAEDFNKAASIIERLGSEFIAQGRSSILLSYIEKIPKSIRIRRALLLMYYAQALTLSDSGRLDDARDSCLLAVKLLKTKKTGRKKYADALYRLGGIVLNQGKYNAAKRWFKEALRVCPQSSSLTRASILNSIGSIYNAVGGKNIHLAEPYFKKALKIVQRGKYRDLEASILNNWAQTKMKMGDLSDAYAKHAKMVELLKHYYSPGCGAGFYNAARTSLLLGYQKEARSILDAGIKMTSAYNDLLSMARIWEGYAMVYQATGDQKKALQLGTKALEIYEKLGIVYLIISALREMVNIYMMSFEYAEASGK
jgi:LuxR family maltose regulon positive regulatory protein